MINHIINECSKLIQYKTGYDEVEKVIEWEFCQKF